MRSVILFLGMCTFLFISCSSAQSFATEHIMTVDSGYKHDKNYRIDQLSWIAGSWAGKGFGGDCEEIWSAPKNGHMMCVFRFDQGDQLIFTEHCSISETVDGIQFRVRHFNQDFTAWEDKESFVIFPLIKIEDQKAYFDGCTMERSGDTLRIYVNIQSGDTAKEELFVYQLQ